jgi:hypothetical protein
MRYLTCLAGLAVLGTAWSGLAAPLRGTALAVKTDFAISKVKTENGLILAWNAQSDVAKKPDLSIFSASDGKLLLTTSVLATIPDARDISIYDVSARRSGHIAVAIVGVRKAPPHKLAAGLLLFNWEGHVTNAIALDPAHGIQMLEVDDADTVWAVGVTAAGQPVDKVPLIIRYDPSGNVVGAYLTRSMFPFHAYVLEEGPEIGELSFGITESSRVWLWLPYYNSLVTISTVTGAVSKETTGLPDLADAKAMRCVLIDDDRLFMEVTALTSNNQRHFGWYVWTRSGGWRLVGDDSDRSLAYLYGLVNANEVVIGDRTGPDAPDQVSFRKVDVSSLLTQ